MKLTDSRDRMTLEQSNRTRQQLNGYSNDADDSDGDDSNFIGSF